jgi:hypothetical protein
MTEAVEQAVELGLLIEGKDGIQVHHETIPRQVFVEMIWAAANMDPGRAGRWRQPASVRDILTAQWPPMLYEVLSSVCHTVLAGNAPQEAATYILVLAEGSEASLITSNQSVAEHFRDGALVATLWAAYHPRPLRKAV